MDESPQDQYAKNLPQRFGYPLRIPEPKPGLPLSYEEHGLQIGDVGYVNEVGMFEVLFNIRFTLDHELHRARRKDLSVFFKRAEFNPDEAPPIPSALPSPSVLCHGIQEPRSDNLSDIQSASCKFVSCSTSGAILVLPAGAVLQNLNKSREEEFRKLAAECARRWCQFAACKSLYLITGFYKTSSWYLASFHDARSTGEILLQRDDAGRYHWSSKCSYRKSPIKNRHENQTVLISGFKIEVKWDKPVVVKLAPHSRGLKLSELMLLASFLVDKLTSLLWWIVSSFVFKLWEHRAPRVVDADVRVNRVPTLSQPYHPSDVINRYLLDKNPDVDVAITHDSQWLNMLEENELSYEDMAEEGHFRVFLEKNYTDDSYSDNVVYLRRKIGETDSEDHVTEHTPCSSAVGEALDTLHEPALSPKTFSIPTFHDVRHVVITHMRAENPVACLGRMPVGFYVLVQFDGTRRRSRTKTVLLRDSVIDWEDEIMLPVDSSAKVRLSINASFELEPIVGEGQTLCTSEVSVCDLVQGGGMYLPFSSGNEKAALFITVEERRFDYLVDSGHGDEKLGYGSCPGVAEETDKGHAALLRYHRDHAIAELEKSMEHFRLALGLCASDHECRAATLLNLATARFIYCQVHGTLSDLDAAIGSYREALRLRPPPLPDRPGTQLYLAEALLYHYGRVCCESSIAEEIEMLVAEVKQACHQGSHERRAGELFLQTLKRYRMTYGQPVDLDEFVSELEESGRMAPDWYFDRPFRMMNLSAGLRKRFELGGNLDSLEKSILVLVEAMQLIPDGRYEKPWMLVSLADLICVRFVLRRDVADISTTISMIEDIVERAPDGHVEKPWMVTRLGAALLIRFISNNISGLKVSVSLTGNVVHLTPNSAQLNQPFIMTGTQGISDLEQAISRHRYAAEHLLDGSPHQLDCLTNLASSLLIRFWCLGDASNLEEAISRYKEAVELIPDTHPDKPDSLNNFALALRARFEHSGDLSDLEEATSRHEEAVRLVPRCHPNGASHLSNLGNCLVARFEHLRKPSDVEEAISSHKSAIELTLDGHSDKPGRLYNLALSYRARFQCLGEMDDIVGATSSLVDATELAPDGHPDKPSYLNDLILALGDRFEHLGKLMELGLLRAVKLP